MHFAFRRHLIVGLAAQVLLVGCAASAHVLGGAVRPPISPDPTTNIVALLLLLARLGDIGSTYLATPKMLLEANSLMRRLKWPFAWSTLLVAFVPYFSLSLGVVFLVASLLVCSSNLSGLWLARAVGEDKLFGFLTLHASRTEPRSFLLPHLAAGISVASVGILLLYLPEGWGRSSVAVGIVVYAFVRTIWGAAAFIRFHEIGRANNRRRGP